MTEQSLHDKVIEHLKKNENQREKSLYHHPILKCYIGNGNNSELIWDILQSIGYSREVERSDHYRFKWVQSIQSINWNLFKDGEQMVNHIQGEDYFTTKLQLYQSLQTYEKMSTNTIKPSKNFLPLEQFIPQTFKLDEKVDRENFFNTHQPGDIWICKPSGLNQGKGIYLVRDLDDFKEQMDCLEKKKQMSFKPMKRIIQRYLINPLLINGKKFDIRCYMLISSVKPILVFYHSGYIRLSMFDFDRNDENLLIHLTNQYMQKKDPQYDHVKEDTAWTMEQFNDYLNTQLSTNPNLTQDWALNVLPKLIIRIMLNVVESIRMRLKRRVGCFGLYGYDFMIDQEMKVWLIEINVNPAITTNTNTLLQAIPPVVKESIQISIECFEKIRHSQKVFPLKSLQGFQCIYNELERKGSLPYLENKNRLPPPPPPERTKAIVHPTPIIPDALSIMRSQTLIRSRSNLQIFQPTKVEAEEWIRKESHDMPRKDSKSLVYQTLSIKQPSLRHTNNLGNRRSYTRKSNFTRPFSSYGTNRWEYSNDLTPALTKSAFIYQLIRTRLEANLARSRSFNSKDNVF